jgi:hypothetical protein
MNIRYVDLHCHSTASDGTLSPTEVVQLAAKCGLSGLALTDHDTTAGVAEAQAEAKKLGIDFLPAIEVSAEHTWPGMMDLLGYGIDPANPVLKQLTVLLIEARDNRNPKIVAKLNEMGMAVTMADWEAEAKGGVLGRPQLAAILFRKNYVSSIKEAFDKFIGQGCPAYFDKGRVPPRKAIEMIRQAGGIAVAAHPVHLKRENDAQLNGIIKDLVDMGLRGIEVMHSDHTPNLVEKYSAIADRYGLLKTGGSDFHGSNKKGVELGLVQGKRVPREWFDALRNELSRTIKSL